MKIWTLGALMLVGGLFVSGSAMAADERGDVERGNRNRQERVGSLGRASGTQSDVQSTRFSRSNRSGSESDSRSSRSRAESSQSSRSWRSSGTSLEINRRLSPSNESSSRVGRESPTQTREFQDLRHNRQALTGTRNTVRVWTPRIEREPVQTSTVPESESRDRRNRTDDRDSRMPQVSQNQRGAISPSDWQEHRQSRIDARRGESRNDSREDGDRSEFGSRDRDGRNNRSDRTNRDDRGNWNDRNDRNNRDNRGDDNHQDEDWKKGTSSSGHEWDRDRGNRHDSRTHRHHDGCGHFQYGGGWHDFPKEHKHHNGCGHHFYDNDWHRWSREHRHRAGCGHYYNGGSWFDFPRGHRHGPRCGHYHYDGYWHYFPKTHSHGPSCGHYYYESDWHFWPLTHRHHAGCGHFYFNSLWFPFAPTYYGYTESITVYGGTSSANYEYARSNDHAERAYERSRNGDFYGAIAAFSTAIATTADNGPLYLAQGLTYMQVGDYRSAYSRIVEGLRRTPDVMEGHPDLRALIPDPETVEWYADELTWALEDNPGNERALFVLGYLRFLKGDYEDAKIALQAAAALNAGNEQAPRLLDFIYQIEAGQAV